MCLKLLDEINSVDPDQIPNSTVSNLSLCYLLRQVCLNNEDKWVFQKTNEYLHLIIW